MTTPQQMKRVHDEHLEAEARQDIDAIMATYHDDCFHETIATGMKFVGKDAVRMQYEGFFTAFPDADPVQVSEAFGEDVLMDRSVFRGTLKGPLFGIAPTGRRIELPFARAVLFKDGLIHGEIGYFDLATLCEQAGIPIEQASAAAKAMRESLAAGVR